MVASAAAEIGARVLATVAEAYDVAETLPRRWASELAGSALRPPPEEPELPSRPDGGPIVV